MNILICGGAGFIGSHFIEHIMFKTDWDITVLDALTYAGDTGRIVDTSHRIRFFWHDLRSPISKTMRNRIGKIDYVVNFASESHVDNSIKDPIPFVHNNIMLIMNIMQFALDAHVQKFLTVSTDEVFGPAVGDKKFSEWDIYKPSNPYAASKASQDCLAISYWRTYGLPLIITNAMNNFGERQHPEKLIPKAIKKILAGEEIRIYADDHGTGDPQIGSRFWLHARNHSDAILHILRHIEPSTFPQNDVPERFNIVGEVEKDNLEIVELIGDIMKIKPKYSIDFGASRPGHDIRYALDGSKLRGKGWVPPVNFEESFRRTVKWTASHPEWL